MSDDTVKAVDNSFGRVWIAYESTGCWQVLLRGSLLHEGYYGSLIVATYATRDSANAFAKKLRGVLRDG